MNGENNYNYKPWGERFVHGLTHAKGWQQATLALVVAATSVAVIVGAIALFG